MNILRTLAFKSGLVLMLCFLGLCRRLRGNYPGKDTSARRPFLLGHRGARVEAPENSLRAFALALEAGANGIELDVFLSRDGYPVVVHDRNLQRLCGVPLDVCKQTRAELTALELLRPDGQKSGEHIPTLQAVFKTMPRGTIVNVELKNGGAFSYAHFVRRVLKDYESFSGQFEVILSAFNPLLLWAAKKERPPFLLGLLAAPDELSWLLTWLIGPFLGASTIHLHRSLARPVYIKLAHWARLEVVFWTVNNEGDVRKLVTLGADGIISDNPRLMSRAMKA
jgi:glycerophosphoryl diester phosphodiesterase